MLKATGLSYTYPSQDSPSAGPLDLSIPSSALVVITGPTGCGKSTLLRLLAGLLQRHGQGETGGLVSLDGAPPSKWAPSLRARSLGFVNQCPGDQIVAGTIHDELAFGLESAGASMDEIQTTVEAWIQRLGFVVDAHQSPRNLSGGEQQQLVIASAVAAGGKFLLLDEPLAQLDPPAATRAVGMLVELARNGATVVVVEHRLEPLWDAADRLIMMDEGHIILDARPGDAELSTLEQAGLSVPPLVALRARSSDSSVQSARGRIERTVRQASTHSDVLLQVPPLTFTHRGQASPAISTPELRFCGGERVAILGHNGSGKSTLLQMVSGSLPGADLECAGRIIGVPQDPDLCLFSDTVFNELAYAPSEARRSDEEISRQVHTAAVDLSLEAVLDTAPQALSRGQRLRVAVGAAMTAEPDVLVLDEPTAGQDGHLMERMMQAIDTSIGDGLLLFATHDVLLALRWSTRVLILKEGTLLFDGPPFSPDGRDAAHALEDPPAWVQFCRDQDIPVGTVEQVAGWLK
jgi:energy-coupling factor transport system ATP-binding protein